MMNQIILVGRIYEKTQSENGLILTLAISRPFKNEDGEYKSDYIDVTIWNNIAEQVQEYCYKGDVIGIRGRLETKVIDEQKNTCVIADKVTFLSTKKEEQN